MPPLVLTNMFLILTTHRMEALDVRNLRGIAKLLGTLISLAGVITMTSYKGPAIQSFSGASQHIRSNFVHKSWTKGSILVIASCITWSIWYIMQVATEFIETQEFVTKQIKSP